MRAVVGPDLELVELPDPVPEPGEVLVDVAATAVNRADLLQRKGLYPPPPGASEILGLECSGRIGEEEVCALLAGGGYASRVAVPEGQVLPKPAGVSLVEAAALPEAACTVWSNLVVVAGLSAGETVLVHGGASGIGTTAIQVAKALGAYVVVTAGSPEKLARCAELGADEGIDYRTEDFAAKVRADVILDIVGASYLARNVAALATGGRLVVIGLQGGTTAELDLSALLRKRGTIHATTLRSRPVEEKAAIVAEVRAHVWPMVESGAVRPVIDRVLPLERAAEAHRVVEASEHVGKVLLQR